MSHIAQIIADLGRDAWLLHIDLIQQAIKDGTLGEIEGKCRDFWEDIGQDERYTHTHMLIAIAFLMSANELVIKDTDKSDMPERTEDDPDDEHVSAGVLFSLKRMIQRASELAIKLNPR